MSPRGHPQLRTFLLKISHVIRKARITRSLLAPLEEQEIEGDPNFQDMLFPLSRGHSVLCSLGLRISLCFCCLFQGCFPLLSLCCCLFVAFWSRYCSWLTPFFVFDYTIVVIIKIIHMPRNANIWIKSGTQCLISLQTSLVLFVAYLSYTDWFTSLFLKSVE